MPPAARVGDMHVCPMQTPGSHRFRMWAGRYFRPAALMSLSEICPQRVWAIPPFA